MNDDYIMICFHCGEIRDMPPQDLIERLGDVMVECCDQKMYKWERNKMYLLTKNIDKVRDELEKRIVEELDA